MYLAQEGAEKLLE